MRLMWSQYLCLMVILHNQNKAFPEDSLFVLRSYHSLFTKLWTHDWDLSLLHWNICVRACVRVYTCRHILQSTRTLIVLLKDKAGDFFILFLLTRNKNKSTQTNNKSLLSIVVVRLLIFANDPYCHPEIIFKKHINEQPFCTGWHAPSLQWRLAL